MTNESDIDQLLARAAGFERARHVDPAFVQLIEHGLKPPRHVSVLRFLPALSAVFALFFVVPGLTGLWETLTEPLGLWALLGVTKGVASFASWDDAAAMSVANLWPYAMGVVASLAPFWLSATDA